MDAAQQGIESTTTALKEWMGEAKKKPKKETKTSVKDTEIGEAKETDHQKKKTNKAIDDMTVAKSTIKRKLVSEPPREFSPAPAVVDAQVNLIKAQLITEIEEAVEKVRVEEQEKAAKVRKTDKAPTVNDDRPPTVEGDLEPNEDGNENDYNTVDYPITDPYDLPPPQVYSVHSPSVPVITVYVCNHH